MLVEKFCPEGLREAVLADERNEDCLVRLYLGKKRVARERESRFFTLRNLCLDEMQLAEVGIDTAYIADTMAEALAVIHLGAGIDAGGGEFVLGTAPSEDLASIRGSAKEETDREPTSMCWEVRRQCRLMDGKAAVWLLDSDRCRGIGMDEKGVGIAVNAFWLNDPYYPRPGGRLWEGFRERYLERSGEILGDGSEVVKGLPGNFVEGIEDRGSGKWEVLKGSPKNDVGSLVEAMSFS